MLKERPHQTPFKEGIYSAWDKGHKNILGVLPTGAGKTFVFVLIMSRHKGPCVAIAHRQELVYQISIALARFGVRHQVIGPKSVIQFTVRKHMEEYGKSFIHPNAQVYVAGVDTIRGRSKSLKKWGESITLWVQDEAHHVLQRNKWGKVLDILPNAKGLGVTATPTRADGYGLGRHAEGVFDTMVVGAGMREIINLGYLSDYRIICAKSDLGRENLEIGSTGDYKHNQLRAAARDSHIVGDIVDAYMEYARGKLGVTFIPDAETGAEVADKFNRAGIRAELITYKTPDGTRDAMLKAYARREILQLVNIDLFGEGFDCPAMQVASFGRPTMSYPLYVQQFGRPLRIDGSGDDAIIIDHVGNVMAHGLPDRPQRWTLDGRTKNDSLMNDVVPLRECDECSNAYERIFRACPVCGAEYVPAERKKPEHVDGDLTELSPEALDRLRSDMANADMTPGQYLSEIVHRGVPKIGQKRLVRKHVEAQEARAALRESIAWWAGYQRRNGRSDSESYKRFFWKFGIDAMSAQSLKARESIELANRINTYLGGVYYV